MFTFGHNLALGVFGKALATPARKPWREWLDRFITVVLAVPSMLFAVPIELIGGLFRRGGSYRVKFKVL
jgi:ABC-type Fe3+ transport system permease subunit